MSYLLITNPAGAIAATSDALAEGDRAIKSKQRRPRPQKKAEPAGANLPEEEEEIETESQGHTLDRRA